MMIKRILHSQILQSLQHFPAVGLVGARQVGKTTLAQMIAKQWPEKTLYLDLERPTDYSTLSEPELFLSRHTDKLVIIDEIQLRGDLFPVLRSLIDMDRHPGRFLLLGSSSPDLIRQSGESLAGRIAYHELSPLLLSELSQGQMDLLWMRGGFPDSTLAESENVSIQWREDFIMTYLQRDLSFMGYDVRIPVMKLRRFWQMLAHTHGQLINLSQLAMNMELSRQSIRKYLDILQETFMVRQLQPFHTNLKKRLVKSSKIFIRDSGILHTLIGNNSFQELMGHSILGMSWEGFCMEQILSQIPRTWGAFFYRSQAGAEVDLILQQRFGEAPIFVEFKYSQSPKLTKGFWEAKSDLKPNACYVIFPGTHSYPLSESVEVLPLSQIDKIWQDV
ncbi:MAG: ATP-binding protein [Sedimentisphaerales bacterium]